MTAPTLFSAWASRAVDSSTPSASAASCCGAMRTTWTPVAVPPANDLYGVNGSGPTNVYAVGDTGSILHYDGVRWSSLAEPATGAAPIGVDRGSRPHLHRRRRRDDPDARRARPSRRSRVPTTRFLRSVWGIAPNDVYAVGDTGTIIHFDGSRWTTMTSGTSFLLRAVWGSGSTDVFAVGEGGTALRYDGVRWYPLPNPTTKALRAVWGTSPTDIYAAGEDGVLFRFNGSALDRPRVEARRRSCSA